MTVADRAMRASVVIATYGRPCELQRLVDGLARQTVAPGEVIVVDDGHERPAAPEFPADTETAGDTVWTLIRRTNGGAGAARHTGIEHASNDVIVILDDDMVVPSDLVAAHLAAHHRGVDVVQGHFDVGHRTDRPLFDRFIADQERAYFERCALDPRSFDPARLATGNVSFRRELYERVGGFDLALSRREDAELGLKFAAHGAIFEYRHDAAAVHDEPPESLDRWLEVADQYGGTEAAIARRHPDHSPWALFADMPAPARLTMRALRCSPSAMRHTGRGAARVSGRLERVGIERLAVTGYGFAFALHWFAGLFEAFGRDATRDALTSLRSARRRSVPGTRIRFGDVDIDVIDRADAVARIVELAGSGGVQLVVTPNVDHLVRARRDATFRAAYRRAALVLADGQPLIIVARLLRLPLRHKLSGSDMLEPVLQAAVDHDLGVFFLGATEETSAEAARRLVQRFAGLRIVGRASPWFGLDDDLAVLDPTLTKIAESGAQVVIVALGTPKQEVTLERLARADRLPPACYCGFGAGLDFAAGVVTRAPTIVSRLGFEWLWRLALEPRRLWKRYIVDDVAALPIFVSMTFDRLRGRSLVIERDTAEVR